jgi:nucleoside-diphosphate-sugar epimerase
MKKALVTGHLGFVGRNLCEALALNRTQLLGIEENIFEFPNWDIELENSLDQFSPEVIFTLAHALILWN